MVLYLSGARHPESDQLDPTNSLGGYISSTPVPNGRINALFGEITSYGMKNQTEEVVGLFLKNTTGQVVNNLTLQQIYNNTLGVDDNLATFEWAVVQPKDNNYMERVGNKRDIPFNANFFNPIARREDATLKIITGGSAGDVVEVLGVNALLQGSSIEDVVIAIVDAFQNNIDFIAEPSGSDSVYFRRKELVFTNQLVNLITPGSATAVDTNLSGGVDEGFLLIEKMEIDQCIGIWIKRKISKLQSTSCKTLEEQYDEMFGKDFSENSMNDQGEEECLESIFSWT